jgi:hypothetical protein
MRAVTSRSRSVAVLALLAPLVVAGCAGAPTVPGPAVPTFAPGDSPSSSIAASAPLDPCAALITPEDVAGVLGMDPGKVAVRTVRGQPAPAVGRTERLDCSYVGDKGDDLFDIRTATYDTTISAGQQWMLNLQHEDGDHRDVTVGPAEGLIFTRKGEQLLTVLNGNKTLALELPDKTAPQGRAKENLIIDFAQRALKVDPNVTPTSSQVPAPGPAPTSASRPPVAGATG